MIDFTWGGRTTGTLTKGCIQCIQGRKSVLFVTGHCNLACYYCPVSNQKMHKGHMYINEVFISENMKIENAIKVIIQELELCQSHGISITGGDPLLAPERIVSIGKALKEYFGKNFHIHLYTPGREGSKEMFSNLVEVLDEIRFHPTNKKDLETMILALDFSWDVGIELPATINLSNQSFFKKIVDSYYKESIKRKRTKIFMNLNELEITESNFRDMKKYIAEENILDSFVFGSKDEAFKIQSILPSQYPGFDVFFCPQSEKDHIQISKRYTKRAESVAFSGDIIEPDGPNKGLLMRGIIKLSNHSHISPDLTSVLELEDIKKHIIQKFKVSSEEIIIDYKKTRIITSPEFIDEFKEKLHDQFANIEIGILEESPAYDQIEFSYINL